jgi:anti-sigma B factor antagonist
MHITERTIQDVVVLDLKGRLTIEDGADPLHDKFNNLIHTGHSKVLLNMGGVPHLDSGALGTLVSCKLIARKTNSALKLFGLSRRVVELLAITKLTNEFDTFDTEDEALSSFMATV